MMSSEREYDGWDYAVDWLKVDGLAPSDYMRELIELERMGEITKEDIEKALYEKYRK